MNRVFASAKVYIKREDELSSGIAGSKYRKLASLIPFFRLNAFDEILLIGGAQSNNIVGTLQLLNENNIKAKLMLLESNEAGLKGNLLWMSLLHDMNGTIWVSRVDWKNVMELATNYQILQKEHGKNVFILPEGCAVAEAMPGAMTLAFDILENEKEYKLVFDHIFMDSGSGASAIGLIMGLQHVQKDCQVHITLIAGTKEEFIQQYNVLRGQTPLQEGQTPLMVGQTPLMVGQTHRSAPTNLHFHKPVCASAFGSITTTILMEAINIARDEGILMDPVYSVKHFMTAMEIIAIQRLNGNILFIYGGGSFALSGFQEKLTKLISD